MVFPASNELSPDSPDGGYQILPDGTLMVEPSGEPQRAVFECMAKSPMGEVKSRPVSVRYVPVSDDPAAGTPLSAVPHAAVAGSSTSPAAVPPPLPRPEQRERDKEQDSQRRPQRQSYYERRRPPSGNREDNRLTSLRRPLLTPSRGSNTIRAPEEANVATHSEQRGGLW